MILTITLNPCVDKSTTVQKLEAEAKLRSTQLLNEPGGGGINVSKALQKLGVETVALLPAGGHNGDMLLQLLQQQNIQYQQVNTSVETRENWVVVESEHHKQYRFTFPGRKVEEACIKDLIELIDAHAPAWVVASGSLPEGLPPYFYGLIIKKAHAAGARCIVDTSGAALEALRGRKAYLIKPNLSELKKVLGASELKSDDVPQAARRLISDAFAEVVAVSMGKDGAWLVTATEQYFVQSPQVTPRSTVGAGDSMVAGMTYMLWQQQSLHHALCMGVACGSAATMNEGTQLFKPEDARQLFAQLISD